MKRLASEIITDLEMRIAQLEKKSAYKPREKPWNLKNVKVEGKNLEAEDSVWIHVKHDESRGGGVKGESFYYYFLTFISFDPKNVKGDMGELERECKEANAQIIKKEVRGNMGKMNIKSEVKLNFSSIINDFNSVYFD